MNNFSGIGRVGGDPSVNYTNEGKAICSFSVAIDSGYGEKKLTTWIKVVLFDKRATVSEYIRKGDRIGVTGEIVLRDWTDKQGVVQKSLELANANVTLLAEKRDQDKPSAPRPSRSQQKAEADNFDPFSDNVPF
jgi:single-strand DNA-binding protein